MAEMNRFGEFLRKRRERLGLRIEDVADQLGRPSSFIWRLESGKNANPPDPDTLHRLGDILDVPDDVMLEEMGYLRDLSHDEDRDNLPPHMRASFLQVGTFEPDQQDVIKQLVDTIARANDRKADRQMQDTKRRQEEDAKSP